MSAGPQKNPQNPKTRLALIKETLTALVFGGFFSDHPQLDEKVSHENLDIGPVTSDNTTE